MESTLAARKALRGRLRGVAYSTRLGPRFLHKYPYFFEPAQLLTMVGAVDGVRDVEGSFLEIGCARGTTTVFLNRHLRDTDQQRRYVCIDTFTGFVERDIEHEIEARGKDDFAATFEGSFRVNDPKTFAATMKLNGFDSIEVVPGDIAEVDLTPYAPVAFCLLDVDLYLPIRDGLAKLAPVMAPGGVIVVDDCAPGGAWDGALQAYDEFVAETGRQADVRARKLGFLHF